MLEAFSILFREEVPLEFYMKILREMDAEMRESSRVSKAGIVTATGSLQVYFYTEEEVEANVLAILGEESVKNILDALGGKPKTGIGMNLDSRVGDSEVLAVRFAARFLEQYPGVVFSYDSESVYTAEEVLDFRDSDVGFSGYNNLRLNESPAEREVRLEQQRREAKDEVARAEIDSVQFVRLLAGVEIPQEFYLSVLEEMHAEMLKRTHAQRYDARVAWATGSFYVWLRRGEFAENAVDFIFSDTGKRDEVYKILGGKPQIDMRMKVTEIGDSMVGAAQFLARFAERSPCVVYDSDDERLYMREEVLRLRDEHRGFVGYVPPEKRKEAGQQEQQDEPKKPEPRGWEHEDERKEG